MGKLRLGEVKDEGSWDANPVFLMAELEFLAVEIHPIGVFCPPLMLTSPRWQCFCLSFRWTPVLWADGVLVCRELNLFSEIVSYKECLNALLVRKRN